MTGLGVLVSVGFLAALNWANQPFTMFSPSTIAASSPISLSSVITPPASSRLSQLFPASADKAMAIPNPPTKIADNRSQPSTVLVQPAKSGGGSLKVINGTNRDAYIKLVEPSSRALIGSLFVQSGSVFTLKQVPDGIYQVLFVLGEGWDARTQSFRGNKRFAKFDKSLNFVTQQFSDRTEYTTFQLTLNAVVGGNATTSGVSEQEFRKY